MLLADHALAHNDGRMYITGGGFESLMFGTMPGIQQQMSVAVGVAFSPTECGADHILEIRTVGPSGRDFVTSRKVPVRPLQVPSSPQEDTPFQFVWNLRDVIFPAPGAYSFVLAVDGETCTVVNLTVVVATDRLQSLTQVPVWRRDLDSGYQAYQRGDAAEAERLFQGVVDGFPDLPFAHNNLAFVRLASGKADAAKAGFIEAARLGMPSTEILEFNLACCEYLLGNIAGALTMFRRCLQTHSLSGSAILFGIADDGLFPAQLAEPGDYVGLAAMNAAWCAWRMGDGRDARTLLAASVAAVGDRELALGERWRDYFHSSSATLEGRIDRNTH